MKRIAIIDDDEIFQFTTRVRLEKLENIKEIISFEDGERAYDYLMLGKDLPHIILLDINMPIVDGWDFLELYKTLPREIHKKITLYMISSSINPEDLRKAKENQFVNEYLVKPLEDNVLEKLLQ